MAFSLRTWIAGDRWNLTAANDLETRIQAALPVQFATIASAATIAPAATASVVSLTGTTTVTTITATFAGHRITIISASTAQVTDGSNLKLVGNYVGAANSTLSLVCDGTNWYETGRTAPG